MTCRPLQLQKRLTLVGTALCLFCALGIVLFGSRRQSDGILHRKYASELPLQVGGWSGKSLPLGNGEVMDATGRLLNYDDYIFRSYVRGTETVFIYAMFWNQGSISVREIAGHTPDGCWVANGAVIDGLKASQRFSIDGQLTATAEVRQFLFTGGQRVQVAWWHIWGEDLVDRGFDQKSIVPTLREMWIWLRKRHGMRRNQILIRIHTTGDIATAMQTEPVLEFIKLFPEAFTAREL